MIGRRDFMQRDGVMVPHIEVDRDAERYTWDQAMDAAVVAVKAHMEEKRKVAERNAKATITVRRWPDHEEMAELKRAGEQK